jgi:DNA-directed RNA polymerase subunit H (RpoH/RPB5)
MVYEVKMQTYSSTMNGHCTHVRYELLDENQNILKRMTVNHRQYPYVWIADELVLKRGDILRINASESEYSGACQAWLDQLEITQKFIDKFAPVITIAGEQIVEVQQGATYFDMGATLSDNLSDVDVSLDISSNVDMSLPGTYQVVYTATDMSGNVSTKTRTVEVVAPAAP